jgi:hypothetical protein
MQDLWGVCSAAAGAELVLNGVSIFLVAHPLIPSPFVLVVLQVSAAGIKCRT